MDTQRTNQWGQPVGPPVLGWTARQRPSDAVMQGRTCWLEPLEPDRHGPGLFAAFAEDDGRMWSYFPWGPFQTAAELRARLSDLPAFQQFAILEAEKGEPLGLASYMRHDLVNGSVEVGALLFSPSLQRTVMATEAMYLMMRQAFDGLGYRRYEWKCDALNAPSRAAAARLGFRYEGTHRQATVYRDRSRDTAWFSILDSEWPAVRAALEAWLDPANFDDAGAQRRSLSSMTRPLIDLP